MGISENLSFPHQCQRKNHLRQNQNPKRLNLSLSQLDQLNIVLHLLPRRLLRRQLLLRNIRRLNHSKNRSLFMLQLNLSRSLRRKNLLQLNRKPSQRPNQLLLRKQLLSLRPNQLLLRKQLRSLRPSQLLLSQLRRKRRRNSHLFQVWMISICLLWDQR